MLFRLLVQSFRRGDQRCTGTAGTIVNADPAILIQLLPDVLLRHRHACHSLTDAKWGETLSVTLAAHVQLHIHIPEEILERLPLQAFNKDSEELSESAELFRLIFGSYMAVRLIPLVPVIPVNGIYQADREQVDRYSSYRSR